MQLRRAQPSCSINSGRMQCAYVYACTHRIHLSLAPAQTFRSSSSCCLSCSARLPSSLARSRSSVTRSSSRFSRLPCGTRAARQPLPRFGHRRRPHRRPPAPGAEQEATGARRPVLLAGARHSGWCLMPLGVRHGAAWLPTEDAPNRSSETHTFIHTQIHARVRAHGACSWLVANVDLGTTNPRSHTFLPTATAAQQMRRARRDPMAGTHTRTSYFAPSRSAPQLALSDLKAASKPARLLLVPASSASSVLMAHSDESCTVSICRRAAGAKGRYARACAELRRGPDGRRRAHGPGQHDPGQRSYARVLVTGHARRSLVTGHW